MYDSSAAGPGTFTFDPVSKFQIIGIDKHIETNTPRPVSKRELLDLKKRITMDCSDKQMTKALWSGYYGARDLANTAIVNIERQGPDDPLYKQFFGSNHFVDVMANFNTIVSMDGPSNLGCDIDGKDHGNQVYSYRKFNTTSINFYRKFFDLPDDGGLCLKAFYDPRGTRGGAMMVALGPHRGFNVDEKKIKCVDLEELTDPEKFTNAVSYAVSTTKTPRHLPRVRMLTGVMALIVLRRPGLHIHTLRPMPRARQVMRISEEGGGVSGGVRAYG